MKTATFSRALTLTLSAAFFAGLLASGAQARKVVGLGKVDGKEVMLYDDGTWWSPHGATGSNVIDDLAQEKASAPAGGQAANCSSLSAYVEFCDPFGMWDGFEPAGNEAVTMASYGGETWFGSVSSLPGGTNQGKTLELLQIDAMRRIEEFYGPTADYDVHHYGESVIGDRMGWITAFIVYLPGGEMHYDFAAMVPGLDVSHFFHMRAETEEFTDTSGLMLENFLNSVIIRKD